MKHTADVVVVGGGIIGLSCALAIARRGKSVSLVSTTQPGEASPAAAGMLAPSVEQSEGPAHDFAIAARDFYPRFLSELEEETGIAVPLNRLGILQVAISERGVKGLKKTAASTSRWIDRQELADLEPQLSHAMGAVFNPDDGAVDNVVLVAALERAVAANSGIVRIEGKAASVDQSDGISVRLTNGETLSSETVVLAPGAWGGTIAGAKGLTAVKPCKGQLVSYESIGLRHVMYGPRGYLVPRQSGVTVAGSTMEMAGFDSSITDEGLARVRSAAEEIAPALGSSKILSHWAGLRPITADMQPIIGPDEENPNILYACGHSRNGILLAGLTGQAIAALAVGESSGYDLSQFRPGRF